jgi:hypothetical protein
MKTLKTTIIIFLLLMIFNLPSANAQNSKNSISRTGIRVMPQIGLNLTKLTDEPTVDADTYRAGVEIGIWFQSKETIFIQPGIFLAQQGLNRVSIEDIQNNIDTVLSHVDYRAIKIPIMFGIQAFGARIYTGPNLTYILDSEKPSFTSDEFRNLNLGLNIGAGFNYMLFSFDVRYEYGVSDVFIHKTATANTLTMSAGLKF